MVRQIGFLQTEKDVKEFLDFIQSGNMVKEEQHMQSHTAK
jgi:hypothetical protein